MGVNDPVIFLKNGTLFHPRIRVSNLVTWYVLPEVSCVITKNHFTWMMILSLLTWPPCPPRVPNIGWLCYIPRSEVRVSLGTIPIVLVR